MAYYRFKAPRMVPPADGSAAVLRSAGDIVTADDLESGCLTTLCRLGAVEEFETLEAAQAAIGQPAAAEEETPALEFAAPEEMPPEAPAEEETPAEMEQPKRRGRPRKNA